MWQQSSFYTCCDENAYKVHSAVIYISLGVIIQSENKIHSVFFVPVESIIQMYFKNK